MVRRVAIVERDHNISDWIDDVVEDVVGYGCEHEHES